MKLLIINGPNLNMLEKRDSRIYGDFSLEMLNSAVADYCDAKDIECEFFFSNGESDILDCLQETDADGVVLNAGAYSHYSYAIRDCIECITPPVVEVHLSDITKREDFRKICVFDGVTVARFYGEKEKSYFNAIDYLENLLK